MKILLALVCFGMLICLACISPALAALVVLGIVAFYIGSIVLVLNAGQAAKERKSKNGKRPKVQFYKQSQPIRKAKPSEDERLERLISRLERQAGVLQ